jgi:hypothetical protein
MIGGFDRHFPLPRQRLPAALDSAALAIFRRWRSAVIQTGNGAVFHTLSEVPLSTATELFIYRDHASLRDWEAHGARPENAAAMIHLLATDDGLTIVVGDPHERVAASVLEEVGLTRFGGELPRRAA